MNETESNQFERFMQIISSDSDESSKPAETANHLNQSIRSIVFHISQSTCLIIFHLDQSTRSITCHLNQMICFCLSTRHLGISE